MSSEVEIITFGGGEYLVKIFTAISMLFYGANEEYSIVRPLCALAASVGGSLALARFVFQPNVELFFSKYLFPMFIIPILFVVPSTKVYIIDKLTENSLAKDAVHKPYVVDKVPFLFAKIASFSSSIGYKLTSAIENVMHTPDDVQYCKTGMIFGADTSLDFSKLRLNNGTIAQNIHQFTQQCVIYDIALGRYSIDEMKKTTDLWKFLESRTSNVRMIQYLDPNSKGVSEFLTCKQSIEKMRPFFAKEAEYYSKHTVLKNLPISFRTLIDFKTESQNKVEGQIVQAATDADLSTQIITANSFNDAMSRFAKERAITNQRSIYQTTGANAGNGLMMMRIVIEALVYACFPLILPLSLLPFGIKFLHGWIYLNVWIQLWPPLYAILNYIFVIGVKAYAASVMNGSQGYSIFTSSGLQDLYLDTSAIAGYLSFSVPLLSFYLLNNLQSLVHATGSLGSPMQSAASTAAMEHNTGNYSYANTSMGQLSYDNQSAFQHNSSATLSSGSFIDNYGTHSIAYGNEGLTVNQNPSNLNTSIQTAEAYTQQLQKAEQNARSQVETCQSSFTETMGIAERNSADLIQHVANSESYSQGISESKSQNVQESANWIVNAAESWGHNNGISARESLEYFTGLGLDFSLGFSARGGRSNNINALSEDSRASAENLVHSRDFQEHYQNVFNSTRNENSNFATDEGLRYVENYVNSMENLKSNQEQYSNALSHLNQVSENLSYVQSNTSSVNANLNTEFANWLNDKGALSYLFDKNKEGELNALRSNFIEEKCTFDKHELENVNDSISPYSNPHNFEFEWQKMKSGAASNAESIGLKFDSVKQHSESLNNQIDLVQGNTERISTQKYELNAQRKDISHKFDTENSRPLDHIAHEKIAIGLKEFWNDPTTFDWFNEYSNPK